ncbi:MAG TPA: hypothetical protein VMH32_23800 [Burkholderiales bacterium]|nr:hypothetical protein [Burkholderiales bacterium]
MIRKSIVAAAGWVALSCSALAHDVDPVMDETPELAAMRYCQTVGVRAAWGAQARFLGAPSTFKYIGRDPLKRMFMGEATDIPNDAIYVLDEMNLDQRREYEETAFYGWKQADKWVREGRERPEYEVLAAVFYDGCKKALTAAAPGEPGGTPSKAADMQDEDQ